LTTPVLAPLRIALPGVQIDFLVDPLFAPLLENNSAIRRIQIYDRKAPWRTWQRLRAESYDWILDFQSSPRSILSGILSGARLRAGYRVSFWGRFLNQSVKRPDSSISVTEGKMTLIRSVLPEAGSAGDRRVFLTQEERQWAESTIKGSSGSKTIGLVPTHRRASRRWEADSFSQLGRLMTTRGWSVWFFWGPGEEEYVEAIAEQVPGSRLIPATSLRQMAALFERCRKVVTNDNGPMHLAVAVGTATVTLYGPTSPVAWNPGGPQHRVIQASGLGCLGCNLNECPFGHECMNWITPEKVLEAL